MTSTEAFNQTLTEFLEDLSEVFPEEKEFNNLKLKLKKNILINPKSALDNLGPELAKYSNEIMAKDSSIFYKDSLLDGIDMGRLWDCDISDNNRKAIWDYLTTLLTLSNTIRAIPQGMLSQIESIAMSCANDIDSANASSPEDIFQLAQKTIFQNNDFQNLLSSLSGSIQPSIDRNNDQSSSRPMLECDDNNECKPVVSSSKKKKKKNKHN